MQKLYLTSECMEQFGDFLKERENTQATVEKYQRDVKAFLRYLGGERVVTKEILSRYKEWLLEHYAVSSVNSMITAVNQFLVSLHGEELKIRRVRVQREFFRSASRELNQEDYKKILDIAQRKGKEQLTMILQTICETGIRISELQYFTVEQVKRGRIEILNKGKYRVILLPEGLRGKLLAYIGKRRIKEGYVFCTKSGNKKDRSNLWREMKALSREAGVQQDKMYPHNLRHLFARNFYKETGNLSNLANLLGHTSLEVTRIYTMESMEECEKMLNWVNRRTAIL